MPGSLWSDRELHIAVETYLYVLRLQQMDVELPEYEINKFLANGPLKQRNDASIRYRMRNISSVMQRRGWPTLTSYSPANQVGSGVRVRTEAMLDAHPKEFLCFLGAPKEPISGRLSDDRLLHQEADARLEVLDEALADLEDGLNAVGNIGHIGHNRPPEPIDRILPSLGDIIDARREVRALREELSKPNPNQSVVENRKASILSFGLKLAGWLGERFTKFADAALVTLAPVVVMKVTNTLPLIADAISVVTKYLQHLPH